MDVATARGLEHPNGDVQEPRERDELPETAPRVSIAAAGLHRGRITVPFETPRSFQQHLDQAEQFKYQSIAFRMNL